MDKFSRSIFFTTYSMTLENSLATSFREFSKIRNVDKKSGELLTKLRFVRRVREKGRFEKGVQNKFSGI